MDQSARRAKSLRARRGVESSEQLPAVSSPSDPSQHPRRAAHTDELASDQEAWRRWTEATPVETTSGERGTHDNTPRVLGERRPEDHLFRRAALRTLASTVVPGLGLIKTRAHSFGVTVAVAFVGVLLVLGITALVNPTMLAGNAVRADTMLVVAVLLGVFGIIWVGIILQSYLLSKPARLTKAKRIAGSVLVWATSLIVAIPMAVGSAYALQTSLLSGSVFGSQNDSRSQTRPDLNQRDPWADKPRVNFLLLGGDSGESRDDADGVRTDTIMIASVDTQTGATLLIQIPRNLEGAIFPDGSPLAEVYPYGFSDGTEHPFINAIWREVPAANPDLFTDTDYPGADALKWAISGSTGLDMDYFLMLNIDGIVQLIDAMGGVTVNVNFPIAKHGSIDDGQCGVGGWIAEGPNRHLSGEDAMWYARSRCNDNHPAGPDFGRMRRQSCLVNAVIDQSDPAMLATKYEALADAAGSMVTTDIPQEHLEAIVQLATRVQQGQNVTRISFVNGEDGFQSDHPDFDLVKQRIQDAIYVSVNGPVETPPEETAPVEETTAPEEPVEVPQDEVPQEETTTPSVENVTDACAYQHEESRIPVPGWALYNPESDEPR